MSARSNIVRTEVVEADSSSSMAEEYIGVSNALKLSTPFNGNKREVLTFISNVDTAFEVINPTQRDRLYKFVLTRISGEPRTAIAHRHLENWAELEEFLKNTYIEKHTLDFHANRLFKAKQGKSDGISDWIQQIQTLGSKFREAALRLHNRRTGRHNNIIRSVEEYLLYSGAAFGQNPNYCPQPKPRHFR
jgi:hypothetical protein